MSPAHTSSTLGDEVVWHDVECGGYAADLTLWRELAAAAGGATLELGCGAGRVALDLATAGREVTGVDRSPALIAELTRRACERGLEVDARVADVRELALGREFALVCAPMQLVHLLGGAVGRGAMFTAARAQLVAGGSLALAILAEHVEPAFEGSPPLPDVRERDGWVYSSQPLDVRVDGGVIRVRRLRQLVSPDGSLQEQFDVVALSLLAPVTVEAEAASHGFVARERIPILPSADHVGSTVIVLEAA